MGKKLLYITNGINGSGGLERVLSVKTTYLVEQYNYKVTILCLNNGDLNPFYEFSRKIKFVNVSVFGNVIKYLFQYKREIQRTVDEIDPDIILVCDDGLKGFFLPSIIRTKAKWIYERHASKALNTSGSFEGKIKARLMQWQVKRFDAFVVLTPSNVKEWQGTNIVAIPNPLSFYSKSVNTLDQKIVIAVGSHTYNKGYDYLLKIWQQVEQMYPDWKLHIYGKIDKEETFVKMAKQMCLKTVSFFKPYNPIQEKFEQSSIMVLTSRSEGFGMVLIEAMSCGVPCVSFDCPSGPRDIISNNIDGFLVPCFDVDVFVNRVIELIKNCEVRKAVAKRAKDSVAKYSIENIGNEWDKLFKRV